ncbi:MAG: hypothetical protein R3D30_06290 [Hyphomicrobiales bacterium]
MQLIRFSGKLAAILAAAVFAVALASCEAPSTGDSAWAGTYKTQDTQGGPMEITLEENGSATATRGDEHLDGSWKDGGDTVTITWSEEWSTKITKDGDKYTKTAYKDGSQDGDAVSAEKVK